MFRYINLFCRGDKFRDSYDRKMATKCGIFARTPKSNKWLFYSKSIGVLMEILIAQDRIMAISKILWVLKYSESVQ